MTFVQVFTEEKTITKTKDEFIIDIIDTHIHLWDIKTCVRQWLSDNTMKSLQRTFDIDEYMQMYATFNSNLKSNEKRIQLKTGIFMETDVNESDINTEINEVQEICNDTNNNMKAMIIKLDLYQSHESFVKKFNQYRNISFIKGIRKVLLGKNVYEMFENSASFLTNLKYINDQNANSDNKQWVIDICVDIQSLAHIEIWLKNAPNVEFILDHCGNHHQMNAENKSKLFDIWKQSISQLSKYKNLNIKLSGLQGGQPSGLTIKSVIQENEIQWSFDLQKETIDFVLKTFDSQRMVYGSDWPVSLLVFNNDQQKQLFMKHWTMNLYKYIEDNYGQDLCHKIFLTNAQRIYHV